MVAKSLSNLVVERRKSSKTGKITVPLTATKDDEWDSSDEAHLRSLLNPFPNEKYADLQHDGR